MTASPNYTVDNMVLDIFNDYVTPNSQSLFQQADVINHMDKAMRTKIIPLVNSAQEEYFVTLFDQPVVATTNTYTFPQRSAGAILRDVVFVDTQGNEIELTRLSPVHIKSTFPFGYQLPLYTFGYYLQNDKVILYPQQAVVATAYTLRMKFLRRPNNLTSTVNCGQITIIAGNVLTLNNMDSTWTTSTTFDIIQNFPQFQSIADATTITNINLALNQVTLTTVPSTLAVGMFLCPTLMTCVPQIPYEAYDLLIAATSVRLARGVGDSQGLQLAEKNYEDGAKDFIKLISPRVQGGRKIVVNRNNPFNFGIMGTPFLR